MIWYNFNSTINEKPEINVFGFFIFLILKKNILIPTSILCASALASQSFHQRRISHHYRPLYFGNPIIRAFAFFCSLLLLSAKINKTQAQSTLTKPKVKGWHLLSKENDGYYGTGVTAAYELLKNKKSTTVTIAIIDSGVDTLHEDLKDNLWINPNEIPYNGIDDDGNGYIDDIHGWNFCGSKDGKNLDNNSHEITRVYHNWKNEFEGKEEKDIAESRKFMFLQWQKAKKLLDKDYNTYLDENKGVKEFKEIASKANSYLTAYLEKKDYKLSEISWINKRDSTGWAAKVWQNIFNRQNNPAITNTQVLDEVTRYLQTLENYRWRKEDKPTDTRGPLTNDNYLDINDKNYGNNNLTGASGNHGTHVAGIIGAVYNNNIGVDGMVHNVKLMILRAVPGGDEHDKDVALAIRYAVDNGASIINMSFGKPVSPYKQFVDDAIKYAASKNVLLVHGSGNDAANLEENTFYPNPFFLDNTKATNLLTIGASGDITTGSLTANFSNYGNKTVDIFSPGVYINSTTTGNNYDAYDGTSMASPVAAGVCGLLKSYFPKLTPQQIIEIVLQSGTSIKDKVQIPGADTKTWMKDLCTSGKIINALEAVKLALIKYSN